MQKNKQAFTLIELLVAVLIIGVLAAIAVPQYQKAVWRARLAGPVAFVRNLEQAMNLYVLENGPSVKTSKGYDVVIGKKSDISLQIDPIPGAVCDDEACHDHWFEYSAFMDKLSTGDFVHYWRISSVKNPIDSFTCDIYMDGSRLCRCEDSDDTPICDLIQQLIPRDWDITHDI